MSGEVARFGDRGAFVDGPPARRQRTADPSLSRGVEYVPLRLTPRGRTAAVAVAVTLLTLLALAGGRAAASPPPAGTIEVLVEPGMNLWTLAAEIARPAQDLRDVVREIQAVNGMDSAQIRVGDVVRLPIG